MNAGRMPRARGSSARAPRVRRSLIDDAMGEIARGLVEIGFRETTKRGGIFTTPLAEEVLGWVGLPRAVEHYPLSVSPVVGLHFVDVERRLRTLSEDARRSRDGPAATFARPLGEFMPEATYVEWYFYEPEHASEVRELIRLKEEEARICGVPSGVRARETIEETARDLTSHVERYGLPFMRAHTSLANLSPLLDAYKPEDEKAIVLPVVLVLLGERERAHAIVDEQLRRLAGDDDMYSEGYRTYADRFRTYVSASESRSFRRGPSGARSSRAGRRGRGR